MFTNITQVNQGTTRLQDVTGLTTWVYFENYPTVENQNTDSERVNSII